MVTVLLAEDDNALSLLLKFRLERSASLGLGFSPLVDRFALGSLEESIISLKSQSMSVGYYWTTRSSKHAYGISAQATHQEISFDPGNYLWIYSISLSWDLRFR